MISTGSGASTDLCGLFGIYRASGGVTKLEAEVRAAGRSLKHRGPDDDGFYSDEYFAAHFQRLAIIDTSLSGHQPMVSEDGRLVMAYNGEIYNFLELRNRLVALGHDFRGNSDSEVLLAAFLEWGPDCASELRGMFAILCWNRETGVLHVLRDRLGIKPLYFYRDDDIFVFASEIKAILAFCPQAAVPNERAVFKFLARGWIDDSEDTFYAGITSVSPGTWLRIENGDMTRHRFWQLAVGESQEYDAEKFRDQFSDAVALHLQSDVPLAATLSGGMDSSSIVALAALITADAEPIQAFSVIPPETVDESHWINCTVQQTGVKHRYLTPDWSEMPEIFDDVIRAHDEPFQSSSCVYQFMLRREVAGNNIKVLLVGEGGDEVLGGYRRLFLPYLYALQDDGRDDLFEAALKGAPEFLGIDRDSLLSQLANYRDMMEHGGSGQENTSAYGLLEQAFIERHDDLVDVPAYPPPGEGNPNRFMAHLEEHLLHRDIPYVLKMEDRNSMAHGIEARVPFLDHFFIEQAWAYDYSEFMRDGENKSMLRRSMKDLLPDEVVERRDKSPRPGSNIHFVYDLLLDRIRAILVSETFCSSPWWRSDCAEQFEQDRQARNAERAEAWFRLYTVSRWTELYL